jgi:hydroxymethylpyrimidine/phosphomethylpyrimidine kinase
MVELMRIPTAMTIAGSDSGGGAGIQADLKTFAALGVYGTCALTTVTAQNTVGVIDVHHLPPTFIATQIDTIFTDIGADVVKTGMLANSAIIEIVVQRLKFHLVKRLVVDPVMVAKSGDILLEGEAVEVLRSKLMPLAAVVTPNIAEAEALTGIKIRSKSDMLHAAEQIVNLGARSVVVKGGHLEGPATDLFYDGVRFKEFTVPRLESQNTHGTGCTFASAVAAGMAKGLNVIDAVASAKVYVTEAIRGSFSVGRGHGPLNHLYMLKDQGVI